MPKTIEELEKALDIAKERITQLEIELGIHLAFPLQFRLSRSEERIFGLLYKRELLSRESMMNILYIDKPPESSILNVLIHHINVKMKDHDIKIKNSFARGYYMTPEDKNKVLTLMQERATFVSNA